MIDLRLGDCLDVMQELDADSVDTVITDPPYGLSFMGKDWDHGVPGVRFWQEAYRVAKPGAFLLAFGGTRTWHRLAVAIEDAGWQIRDTIAWIYASGFPKSHDISKAIDRAAGAEPRVIGYKRQGARSMFDGGKPRPATLPATLWHGWGTALKPAHEPIIVAMKPLDGTFAENALNHGVAGLNIDGGRIGTETMTEGRAKQAGSPTWNGADRTGGKGSGFKSSPPLNPATHTGRWPANVILDAEAARMLDEQSGESGGGTYKYSGWRNGGNPNYTVGLNGKKFAPDNYGDSGGASRFFYVAKASRAERNAGLEGMEEKSMEEISGGGGYQYEYQTAYQARKSARRNHHPTVKPLDLMRYLCELTKTPTGGVVLDPFMGSGTTGMAAVLTNRDFIGIELNEEYLEIAKRRITWAERQNPDTLFEQPIKGDDGEYADLPLFAGVE